MKKINWNQIVNALILVKIGQDLGTNSQLTQSIHHIIDVIATFANAFVKI
jgi:hypothetical protein